MKRLLLLALPLIFLSAKAYCFQDHSEADYSMNAGNMFYCASTGTVTTQAGVSVSSPAISLYNPIGSGKRLVMLDVGVDILASPAGATGFLLAYNILPSTGVSTGTVSGLLTSAIVGKSTSTFTTTSIASCTVQGILPGTPVGFRYLGGTTGANAIGGVLLTDQTNGKVVIYPGGLVSLQTTAAASIRAHYLWREEPL